MEREKDIFTSAEKGRKDIKKNNTERKIDRNKMVEEEIGRNLNKEMLVNSDGIKEK